MHKVGDSIIPSMASEVQEKRGKAAKVGLTLQGLRCWDHCAAILVALRLFYSL